MKARIMKRLCCQESAESQVAHRQSRRLLWMKSARRESAADCSRRLHPRRGSDGPCSLWPAASDLTAARKINHLSYKQPVHKQYLLVSVEGGHLTRARWYPMCRTGFEGILKLYSLLDWIRPSFSERVV